MLPLSILDLCPVPEGSTPVQALANSRQLAHVAEQLGYRRFWMAEHHNMPGIASAATAVALCHVGQGTSTIRLGAGGVMLPNHAPLVVAEQFGTLASIFPGRIDLGLGRAPGTDPITAHALRRSRDGDVDDFPRDVLELRQYFAAADDGAPVTAVPGAGLGVPLWILGSSLYGASLAAALGLPYAFASHFAPAALDQALDLYRSRFEPSAQLDRPHVMLGMNLCAADDAEEARFLRTSGLQAVLNLRRGRPGLLPRPRADFDSTLGAAERQLLDGFRSCSAVGGPKDVRQAMSSFAERTAADELILVSQIWDPAARVRSYEIAAGRAQ